MGCSQVANVVYVHEALEQVGSVMSPLGDIVDDSELCSTAMELWCCWHR